MHRALRRSMNSSAILQPMENESTVTFEGEKQMKILEWIYRLVNPPQPLARKPETLTKSEIFRRMKYCEEAERDAILHGMHPVVISRHSREARHYANLLEEMKMLNQETIVD